jgi:DNA polymerase/3'-5' exonuclease PolX
MSAPWSPIGNASIAEKLDEVASLLEAQGANRFRVGAYRRAADTLRGLEEPVGDVLERDGVEGLERLPAIGETIARAIATTVRTGTLPQLQRLRGEVDPEALLRTIPGIGPALAERIHHDLHVDTLEDLEAAAHDGRLASVEGFGPRRLEGIRAALAQRLRRVRRPRRSRSSSTSTPSTARRPSAASCPPSRRGA